MKAAYRFFDNNCVDPEEIIASHKKRTIERINQFPVVGLTQDTTDILIRSTKKVENLGVVNDPKQPGCSLHPLIAFTPEKACLGVVNAQFLIRPVEGLGKQGPNNSRKIEDKESYRWVQGFRIANDIAIQCPNTRCVCIGDRESDIYEVLLEARRDESKAELLIRAWHNRKLDVDPLESEEDCSKFFKEQLRAVPPLSETIEFNLTPTEKRTARVVKQRIKTKSVTFAPSQHKKNLPKVTINAVLLEEINPPVAEPSINWFLLTTLPIGNFEEVQLIIDLYRSRWGIELFFKVLKSGCKIEELQFREASRLLACISLYMIVAWRVLYSTFMGRACPDLPCSAVFEDDEWQSVYAVVKQERPPSIPPKLGDFMLLVATLGGYSNRKSDGPPGIIVMWRGLHAIQNLSKGWNAFRQFGNI